MGLIIKKLSIFTGSRKIAKNQGKFRWVIKESSVAGLAGMVLLSVRSPRYSFLPGLRRVVQDCYMLSTQPCSAFLYIQPRYHPYKPARDEHTTENGSEMK